MVLLISILLFLFSLFQECYTVNGGDSIGSFGIGALLLGWMNVSETWFCWLANIFYALSFIAIITSKIKKVALTFSSIAFLLAISFLFLDEVVINEGGSLGQIDGDLLGYWVWIMAIFLIFITSLYEITENREGNTVH